VCGRRLSLRFSKGTCTYFYCLGQKDRRNGTGCRERYVAADQLEAEVEDLYGRIEVPDEWAEGLREAVAAEVAARHEDTTAERELLATQHERLKPTSPHPPPPTSKLSAENSKTKSTTAASNSAKASLKPSSKTSSSKTSSSTNATPSDPASTSAVAYHATSNPNHPTTQPEMAEPPPGEGVSRHDTYGGGDILRSRMFAPLLTRKPWLRALHYAAAIALPYPDGPVARCRGDNQ
jgi:hypothetical protein